MSVIRFTSKKTGRQKHVMSLPAVILVSFLQCDELSADPLYEFLAAYSLETGSYLLQASATS